MSSLSNWYINSDNVIQLDVFYDALNGVYLNAGTVTASMKDLSGTNVSGESWPISLSYVAESNGKYQATVDKDLVLVEGQTYFIEITASQSGIDKFFRRRVIAAYDQ